MFLDFSNIEEEKQMLIYISGWAKQLLSSTDSIFVDGTFKKAPNPFHQLYVIMAEARHDIAVPVAYVLMRRRTKSSYNCLFKHLSRYIGEDQPININVDFEMTVISSIKNVFK